MHIALSGAKNPSVMPQAYKRDAIRRAPAAHVDQVIYADANS
jgi:hypothetical protein